MGLYRRKDSDFWWLGLKDSQGKWVYRSTGQRDRRNAERVEADVREALATKHRIASAPQTVEAWAATWDERRKTFNKRLELASLRNHLFGVRIEGAVFGAMKLGAVRPRHIQHLVEHLRSEEKGLAARTVLNVYGSLRLMFKAAVAAELIDATPCVLDDGALPVVADADAEWRDTAEFTRDEVELLISSELIPQAHRVWWALGFLTGMRAGEVAALRWSRFEPHFAQLGRLVVNRSFTRQNKVEKGTKTDRPRQVPVHPVLAAILGEWKAGWAEYQKRSPKPDDLVLPNRNGDYLTDSATTKWRKNDFAALGLRSRRFHDARSTFITLGTLDGGEEVWLERVTHNAKGNQFNQYRRTHWPALCRAVLCLDVQLRRPLREGEAMAKPEELRFLQNGREGSRSLPSSSSGAAVGARSAGGGRVLEMRRPGSADGDRSGRSELRQRIDALVAAYARGGR